MNPALKNEADFPPSSFRREKDALFAALSGPRGTLALLQRYSALVDKTVAESARGTKKAGLPCIVAVGGYGRRELAPHSDIDLLFLCAGAPDEKFIGGVQERLWNLGLKPACSVRTVDECLAGNDLHFQTALLDRRFIGGDEKLFKKLAKIKTPEDFIEAKLAERDARHLKMGDSRYQLQPNVKEGKGALRDIQTLYWLGGGKLLNRAELKTLHDAHAFFQTVRCHMHLAAGRADDRLAFDMQPEIAARMGYADPAPNLRAEKFMKDYFLKTAEVGRLTRILCAELEARALKSARKIALKDKVESFPVAHSRLTVGGAAHFRKNPADAIRIFRVSQASGLDIHPDALRHMRAVPAEKLRRDHAAHEIFLDILLSEKKAEQTLRAMNEAGILSALIPAFEGIVAHMQYDMYHAFTADEHTLRAVGMLHKIENGELAETAPLADELIRKIPSRRALYAAMFLHDIAKGTGGKHSEKGAGIAKAVCPKLGLNAEETETAAWLVEHHLLMTLTAYKRDLSDPKTIADFIAAVQSPARLKLLTVMTTADIMAVGPDRWNNWKSGLLAELYHKAQAAMSGLSGDDGAQFTIVQKKTRRLVGDKTAALNRLVDQAPRYFWLSFTPESIASLVQALHKKEKSTVIRITPEPAQDFTEVLVHAPDRKGLFATLSGAMAAAGASIVDARIFTLADGMALDVFQVQNLNGHVYDNAPFLQKTLKAALADDIDLEKEIAERQKNLPKKTRLFSVAPRIIIDNDASASSTVIEINARDRPGLLYNITSALTAAGLQISSAKIATFGSRAVDVFYVRDAFGLKVINPRQLKTLEKQLETALAVQALP